MKTFKKNILTLLLLSNVIFLSAQITVEESEVNMDGIIFPRYSELDRDFIISPVEGQCIYNTTIKTIQCFDGIEWKNNMTGLYCWDSNGDGIADPTEDINGDGLYSAEDCQGPDGPVGATGSSGPTGATGATGATGLTGATGATGFVGLTGAPGASGNDGLNCWDLNGNGINDASEDINNDGIYDVYDCVGATIIGGGVNCWDLNGNGMADPAEDINSDGSFNAADCQGPAGPTGASGAIGATGIQGPSGLTGPQGSSGPTGATGAIGAIGATGLTGATGMSGVIGPVGATGATGATGINGIDGPVGATGLTGATGMTGATGVSGPEGPTGKQGGIGPQGLQGNAGATGANGDDGTHCWDINGNGINDPSEDLNDDGIYNTEDCVGSANTTFTTTISSTNFVSTNGVINYDFNFGATLPCCEIGSLLGSLTLPAGTIINTIEYHYYDNSSSSQLSFGLYKDPADASSSPASVVISTGLSAAFSSLQSTGAITLNYTTLDDTGYFIIVENTTDWTDLYIKGVSINYTLP